MTDLTHLSGRNTLYKKVKITVANGAEFEALALSKEEKNKASNVLYLHLNRETRQCYIGITEQEAGKRWFSGIAYTNNRRFGNAIRKYGTGCPGSTSVNRTLDTHIGLERALAE